MKNLYTLLLTLCTFSTFAQVGIGTPTPHPSAQLEINSDRKGLLLPRVPIINRPSHPGTTIQATDGLIIYQTLNFPGVYIYESNRWKKVITEDEPTSVSYAYAYSNYPSDYVMNLFSDVSQTVLFHLFSYHASDFSFDQSDPYSIIINKMSTYKIEYDITPISVSGANYMIYLTDNGQIVHNSTIRSSAGNKNLHGNIITSVLQGHKIRLHVQINNRPFTSSSAQIVFGSQEYDHNVTMKITKLSR